MPTLYYSRHAAQRGFARNCSPSPNSIQDAPPPYLASAKPPSIGEKSHECTIAQENKSAFAEYQRAIHLALRSGASSCEELRQRIPNGRCNMQYLKITNVFSVRDNTRTNAYFYFDTNCTACCRERAREYFRQSETLLKGVVAFLRPATNEIIPRKEWTWDTVRNDESLIALYEKNTDQEQKTWSSRWDAWLGFYMGLSQYRRPQYIDDFEVKADEEKAPS